MLLTWPLTEGRRVVLLECDPDGGAVMAGALEGRVDSALGLRHLAVADRRGRLAETLWQQLVDLSPGGSGDRLLLPGLTDPAQAPGLAYTWEPLMTACQDLDANGCDVLIDLGRSGAAGPSAVLARRADAVLVTVRSTLRGLSAAKPRIAALSADLDAEGTGADALGLVLVQEGPYASAEVGRALGAPVLGLLPFEPRDARVLSDGGRSGDRRFLRSALMRSVRSTADEVRMATGRRRLRLGQGLSEAARLADRAAAVAAAAAAAAAEQWQQQSADPSQQYQQQYQHQEYPHPQYPQQPQQQQPQPYRQPHQQPAPRPHQPGPQPGHQPHQQPGAQPDPQPAPRPAPLAGFAPRPAMPQAFAPPSPDGPTGPGQEVARAL
jgi:hypothetical protein